MGAFSPPPHQAQGRRRPRSGRPSRTFCVHRLLHDDLHPLHVVPVPEAVQGLAVLVSERQDLSHGLPGKETGYAAGFQDEERILTPRKGPNSSTPCSQTLSGDPVPGPQDVLALCRLQELLSDLHRVSSILFCKEKQI